MNVASMRSWRVFILLITCFGVAISVSAQGQSPTSPRPTPQTPAAPEPSDNSGAQPTPPGPRGDTRETTRPAPSSRERRRTAEEEAKAKEEAQKAAGGTAATAEGAPEEEGRQSRREREAAEGTPESGGGTRAVTGGSAAGGAPKAAASAGAGGRFGSNYAVTSTGEGTFEPMLLREPEYGEVPDEGEPLTFLDGTMALQEFLSAINLATGWNIIVSEAIKDTTMNFWIDQVRPKQALDILKFHKVFYTFEPETKYLYVMGEDEWLQRQYGKLESHEFVVKHAEISYIESILSSLLSATGRIITDQRTGRIYVWDTKDNLEQMTKTFEQLDVELEELAFTVKHAEVGDIEGVLNSLMTPNGSLMSDPRTAQIFVWDAPAALDRMRAAVEQLDVPLETRKFDITNVDAENVIDSLEAMISERGLIQVDPRFNSLLVTDLPNKLDRIAETVLNLDRPLETRTWVINYADLDFVADQIEIHIPSEMGEIVVNEEVHQITVTGLPDRLDLIEKLIKVWDVRRSQVLIEAFIVEVGASVEREFNVNWSYFGISGGAPINVDGGTGFNPNGGNMTIGQLPYNVQAYGGLTLDDSGNITRPALTNIAGDPVIGAVKGNRLGVTLDYLDQQGKVTVLSSPRVTVQDGEEAIFENARRVPFISSTSYYNSGVNTGGFAGNNTNRVEFIDVGTILTVTPRITEDHNILMDISAEDSDAVQVTITSNGEDSTVPEKTTRRAETQLRVASAETVVLGGLRKDSSEESVSRTPILGEIPLIGRLFRYPNNKSANRTLLIFLTPTIVDEYTYPESDQLAKAEAILADDHRHNLKSIWKRWGDKMSMGSNEISVSIGQTGGIHSEGERLTVEDLREGFFEVKLKGQVTVIIRKHPSAPEDVVASVTEAAMEAGLRIAFDDRMVPLVASPAERDAGGTAVSKAQ